MSEEIKEIKDRPVFDMNQCKEGDLLESIHGGKLKYLGKSGTTSYPHRVQYLYIQGEEVVSNSEGTRTNEGWVSDKRPLPGDHDIKGFWKGQGKIGLLEFSHNDVECDYYGRNRFGKCKGLEVMVLAAGEKVRIYPHNSKSTTDSCYIEIPVSQIKNLTKKLKELI